MKSRRSFNPFKLWGSWAGAIIGSFMALKGQGLLPIVEIGNVSISIGMFLNIVGGFIAGYGVHLMIRELSRFDKD